MNNSNNSITTKEWEKGRNESKGQTENLIEDEGARALAEALKTNTTLTKLHVGGGQQKKKKNKHTQERGKAT